MKNNQLKIHWLYHLYICISICCKQKKSRIFYQKASRGPWGVPVLERVYNAYKQF